MNEPFFHQAANLSDAEIKSQFIVRTNEFDRVISELQRDDMKGSIQHTIFIGQRGSGKSTLLRRIQAEINTAGLLQKRLVAINLSEEQAGIYRLHDLWESVCQALRLQGFEVQEIKWEEFEDDLIAYAKALYHAMQKALHLKKKKLVLLIDNIDRILETIKTTENHLFRELLMNHKDVRIIGGSTRLSEHHWKYDQPFYEFFRIIRLEALSMDELKALIKAWSVTTKLPAPAIFTKQNLGKLNAVRILSDGMPRTMLYLLELLVNRSEQRGYDYLRSILDKVTPIYQERLGNLSPLQQKVVLEISFFWDAVKIKELAPAAKIEGKTLSAVLNELVKMQIVEKVKGSGKNLLYSLKERFFNLWLLMTQGGPKQKNQVKWLTVFLETWYEPQELEALCLDYLSDLRDGRITPDQSSLLTNAFAGLSALTLNERDEMIQLTQQQSGTLKEISFPLPSKSEIIFKNVSKLITKGDYSKAEEELESIKQNDNAKEFYRGQIAYTKGDLVKAQKHYELAARAGSASAMNNLGILFIETRHNEDAEKYFLMAIEKGHAGAMHKLGVLYATEEKNEQAENYFLLAIEHGYTEAFNSLGMFYQKLANTTKAEECYKKAIDNGHDRALSNLAILYFTAGRQDEAERYFLEAVEKEQENALYNLGTYYLEMGRSEDAEKTYLLAMEKGQVRAMYNLAILCEKSGRRDQAEKYYLMACQNKHTGAMRNYSNRLYLENKEPEFAYNLINSSNVLSKPDSKSALLELIIAVWAGKPEKLETSGHLVQSLVNESNIGLLELFIRDLLIHHQKNQVMLWFKHKAIGLALKTQLKPLYFATLRLINTAESREELLIQAPELQETVDSIVKTVLKRQTFYYGK